ncbi:MAG: hypothetical protein GY832_04670 [Chloroflexi bacterium]|nr:hypothetical protein [Chloroflexota bacterium]
MSKINGWNAFRAGLSHATRYRWVLLILFVVNLLSTLPLAALPALGLATGIGQRPAIRQAADGVDGWLVIETLMSPLSDMTLANAGPESTNQLRQMTLLGLLTTLALPLVAWLPAAFLSGGMLVTYAEAPAPFRWRRFLWGCWHWFGAFLLLSAAQGIVSTALFVPIAGMALGSIAAVGRWMLWIVTSLLALVILLWLALMESIRIAAVIGQTRNIFRAFAQAARFIRSNFMAITGLYGLALLPWGFLHVLYRWGLMPHLPLNWWPLVLIVQQTFIVARLWVRLVRMAGGVALYRKWNNIE